MPIEMIGRTDALLSKHSTRLFATINALARDCGFPRRERPLLPFQ